MKTVSAWPELASILVVVPARMALFKYFKRLKPSEVLKDDDSLTIKEKEMVAEELRKIEDSNRKRQKYCKWTYVQRAEIYLFIIYYFFIFSWQFTKSYIYIQ